MRGSVSAAFVNWPQFHSDPCHTGYNASEFILSPATVGNLVLDWQYTTGETPFLPRQWLVAWCTSGPLTTMSMRWTPRPALSCGATPPAARVRSSPAVANGVVYVGSYDGNVYALNASTGAELWSYTTGAALDSSPAVANGVVYVGSLDYNVYRLHATTGAMLSSYAADDRPVLATR